MSVKTRSQLKGYFLTGATPSESDFSDFIDTSLLVEDLVTDTNSSSTILPLAASVGADLKVLISSITSRVDALESTGQGATDYYVKSEIDKKLSDIDSVLAGFPYAGDISQINLEINNIWSALNLKPDLTHQHSISNITDLQDALDAKVSSTELETVKADLTSSIETVSNLNQSDIDFIRDVEQEFDELSRRVSVNHERYFELLGTVNMKANVTDFNGYYTSLQVDQKISQAGIGDHTHPISEIVGLDQEIQNKTNLLVQDHSGAQNNPHSVTKEQVGLGNVENLTPAQMAEAAGALSADQITGVDAKIDAHLLDANPHNVTKEQVGLGSVPNVDVQQLLNAHLIEENPHNIDLSTFDLYTTSQTDEKIQDYINLSKYNFTPVSNDDNAGQVGDIAYNASAMFIRLGDWYRIPVAPVYKDGTSLLGITSLSYIETTSNFHIESPSGKFLDVGSRTVYDNIGNSSTENTIDFIASDIKFSAPITVQGLVYQPDPDSPQTHELKFNSDTGRWDYEGKMEPFSTASEELAYMSDISALIDAAPDALNTLNELAAAVGDDPQFFSNIQSLLDDRYTKAEVYTKTEVDDLLQNVYAIG